MESAAKLAQITDVKVSGTGDEVQVTVATSAKAAYSLVRQSTPPRLFLQLTGTKLAGQDRVIPVHRGAVTTVKASTTGNSGAVEVFLSAEAVYDVEGRGNNIVLNVLPKNPVAAAEAAAESAAAAQPEPEPAPAPVATPAPEAPVAPPAPAIAAVVAAEPAPEVVYPAGPLALMAIDVKEQADGLVVTLQGNAPLKQNNFIVDGKSLVVDITGADNKVQPLKRKVGDSWVSQIRLGAHERPKKYVRVVFDLKQVGEHRVDEVGNRIVVAFGAPALAPAGAGEGATTTLNTVGPISVRPHGVVTRLEIGTAVKADFATVDSSDPAKVVVEIANAKISEKDAKTLDFSALNLDVVKVSAFPYAKGDARFVRVVAQLRQPTAFNANAEDGRVVVDFDKNAPAPAPAAAGGTAAAGAPPAADQSVAPTSQAPAAPVFTGRRLSLDFKDAEVNDILRLISEVSGLNFVAGPEVKGTVSIKLADVPWDQALDLILKTNNPPLSQVRESDNIMRITTADKIMDEEQRRRRLEEDKRKTVDAQKALEPVFSKTFPISYIAGDKMEEFVKKLERYKSTQGIIQYDERTKLVIVTDTTEKLEEIGQTILTWDAPTPAVLVEARIVEVNSNFGRSVGIQWNATGVKDQAHGNATEFAFPNSVNIGGQQGTGPAGAGNYMVNLPAAVSTGGIGMSFGHIANTLSLDLRLSAGESMGKVKILSNPKVLVVQNQKALITLGSELPIPKTDAAGSRTVEWKPVGIKLDVKPEITNDKRVFMEIEIEKSSQGQNVQTTEGQMFSLNTSKATTKVLIADGETTVIGGIFIESVETATDSIPGLARIPVLGWLFKNKNDKKAKQELMIFITPKIVVM